MEPVRIAMNQHHQINEKAIPGTRNFYHFIPLGDKKVGIKRVSCQDHYDLVFNFEQQNVTTRPTPHSYVACLYDRNWWIGMVMSVNDDSCTHMALQDVFSGCLRKTYAMYHIVKWGKKKLPPLKSIEKKKVSNELVLQRHSLRHCL